MAINTNILAMGIVLILIMSLLALGERELSDEMMYMVSVSQVNLSYGDQIHIIQDASVEYHDPDPILGNSDFCDQHYFIDAYKDYTIMACSIEREYVEGDVLYIELSEWYTWSEQDRDVLIM